MDDISSWEELKSSVNPLKNKRKTDIVEIPLPPKLRITTRLVPELSFTLDLHGLQVAEAYEALKKFILRHQKKGSLHVMVITGKGLKTSGLIKSEIMNWLDTDFFTDKVRLAKWKNDGGALELTLKRIKK